MFLLSTLNDVKGRNYEILGIVKCFSEATDYGETMDYGIENITRQAKELGADGIIGITITSASTYVTNYNDDTFPDIIVYGTAIKFIAGR